MGRWGSEEDKEELREGNQNLNIPYFKNPFSIRNKITFERMLTLE